MALENKWCNVHVLELCTSNEAEQMALENKWCNVHVLELCTFFFTSWLNLFILLQENEPKLNYAAGVSKEIITI